jgi:hypothetical protein
MPEQSKRMVEEVKRVGQEYQRVTPNGFDAVVRSWGELNKGLAAIAAEMTDYSKTAFSEATHAFEQVIGAKSVGQAMEIQSQYAKNAYDHHMAEVSKLGQMYVSLTENAYKPVEQTTSRKIG